jgi:ankyrin repeat protein
MARLWSWDQAQERRALQAAELLLEAGAQVGVHAAAMTGYVERLAELLAADPALAAARDAQGRTPLHCLAMSRLWSWDQAQERRALQAAELLLEAGAPINALQQRERKYQGTPLWWATSSGRCVALVGLLLARGADPEGCLLAAAYQGSEALLGLLLEAGAQVDAVDVRGYTALQHVLLFKRPEVVPSLLALGADPSRTTERGHTALHLAALCGHQPALLESLVKAGAPLEARDLEGRTARELAQGRGHQEAASWLSGAASRA